jgi:hypothetical protein
VTLIGGWLLAPLLLAGLCCGLGLLAEHLAGVTLPGGLVPGVGLAVLVVVAGIPVTLGPVAPAAFVVAAALGAAGLVLGAPWRDPRLPAAGPAALTAATVFALYGAPSLLSGQGSLTGWTALDDNATWFALTDHVLAHGRSIGAGDSSFTATLAGWLPSGYPVGALLPFGVAAKLSGQDLANALAPVVCLYAAILALGLRTIARCAGAGPRSASLVAVAATQASLFYGYAQLGGIKELATAALLPPAAWCALRAGSVRVAASGIVAAGALAGVLGAAGVVWIGPLALLTAWGVFRTRAPRRAWKALGLAGLLAVAALPALLAARFGQTIATEGTLQSELGALDRPLPLLQGAGLWPDADFRMATPVSFVAHVLAIGGLLVAVALGVRLARRGAADLPALVAVAGLGAGAAIVVANPWIDAKALAIGSAFLLFATATAAALACSAPARAARLAGAALAMVLALACGWSTLAVARDTTVASRASMDDLRAIGETARGAGPTLQLDPDPYGDRWFLRDADADGVTDLRRRSVTDDAGRSFPDGAPVDVERISVGALTPYRTLVRRRSPVASTPPAAYVPLVAGSRWEAWTRDPTAPAPLARLALGTPVDPVAPVSCAVLGALIRSTPAARRVVALPREAPAVAGLDAGTLAPGWRGAGSVAVPARDGTSLVPVILPRAGRWRLWIGGSAYGTVTAYIDGRTAGTVRHEVQRGPGWLRFGARPLAGGRHTVAIRFRRGVLAGRHGRESQPALGPVALTREDAVTPRPVVRSVGRWRSLCDRRTYDWVELHR